MLGRILRRLTRRTPKPEEAAFVAHVLAALEEARRGDEVWREQVQLSSDYRALANMAAVRRWTAARLARELAEAPAPPALRRRASETARAMSQTSDAYQRLTNGYRFSKFERVCEGQALLQQAQSRRQRVMDRLKPAPLDG